MSPSFAFASKPPAWRRLGSSLALAASLAIRHLGNAAVRHLAILSH